MTEQFPLSKYRSLEGFALDQTEQFFKPRTFLDLVFLLLLIFWWMSAFLFPQTVLFRVTIFTSLIALFFFTPLYMIFFNDDEKSAASPLNRAGKIFIFYILILISTPNSSIPDILGSNLPISYGELERTLVCILIPFTILLNSFSLKTLHIGYLFYIQSILQGFWRASLIFYFFKGIRLYHPLTIISIDFDLLLVVTYFMFLLGSLLPVAPKQVTLSATDLFNQYQALRTPVERIRDGLLAGGCILFIILFLQWVTLAYVELFQYTAFLSLLIGFILIFTPKKQNKIRFGSLMSAISGQAQVIDPTSQLGNRIQNFAQTIQETEFKTPEQVYTIPSDQMKLVSKGKTSLTAKKGTIAVPNVTEKGTALVLMGKSEMETETEEQVVSKEEIEGTTTIWLRPEEWDKIKLQLETKDLSELTKNELTNAGIDAVTEIFEKTKKALTDLKNWRGPEGLFSSVLDAAPSKYSITETADYSLVRLPGIYVFESSMLEMVNIFGGFLKVIEIKGVGQYVQVFGGFVTVLETPDYSFVQTPFVSVIETPHGERVRVFGIDIQEGDPINLEEIRSKIIQDKQSFDQLFTRRVETLFREDPQLLLTDSKGRKMGFIVGEEEVMTDVPRDVKGLKAIKDIKGLHRHEPKHKRPPSPPSPPPSPQPKRKKIMGLEIGRETSSDAVTLDLNHEGVPEDHPQLLEIDEALARIEESIAATDDRLINNEISETKHTELINRLKQRREKLQREKSDLHNQLKPKLV
ncbi:MAG: hypothetical protein ACFFBQ_09880 [Promethearchaeota archaeon]